MKINTPLILLIFVVIGIIAFFLSFLLNKVSFFYNHEGITFILIAGGCAFIYFLILKFFNKLE